jgi:hypothetical protein
MTPKNPCLFPDTFYTAPLNTWAAAIQRVPLDAQNCLIDWVMHAKAQSSMEHEFLLVAARSIVPAPKSCWASIATLSVPPSPPRAQHPQPVIAQLSLFPREAYDSVQVSHDGTPAPILQQHGRSVPLSFITFARTAAATARSDDDADPRRPSLLHLSILLLTIASVPVLLAPPIPVLLLRARDMSRPDRPVRRRRDGGQGGAASDVARCARLFVLDCAHGALSCG